MDDTSLHQVMPGMSPEAELRAVDAAGKAPRHERPFTPKGEKKEERSHRVLKKPEQRFVRGRWLQRPMPKDFKPDPAADTRPNRAWRRAFAQHKRMKMKQISRGIHSLYFCARCGLLFLGPAARRCQCKVDPPRRSVNQSVNQEAQ